MFWCCTVLDLVFSTYFNIHKFVYWVRSLPYSLFMYLKEKQYKIAMVLLCPVQGPWASSFFLHFNFAYHTNKAPYNISLGQVRIRWLWHVVIICGQLWLQKLPHEEQWFRKVTKCKSEQTICNCKMAYSNWKRLGITCTQLDFGNQYSLQSNHILYYFVGRRVQYHIYPSYQ